MRNDFTLVTSLYNLKKVNRDDNRNWKDYLNWFSETLKIDCPFIIFTEPNLKEFVEEKRKGLETHIVITPLEDIPYYYLKDPIQKVLDSEEYKTTMSDLNRIECKESIYSVIQYSKFKWLKESSKLFDHYKFYFWLDAGASRFISPKDMSKKYPNEKALDALDIIDNSFLIQYNMEPYTDLINAEFLSENYFLDNRAFVCGSMFGGNQEAIDNISEQIELVLNKMITNNCVNNEQISLGYLCKNKKDLFTRFFRVSNMDHLRLFSELS